MKYNSIDDIIRGQLVEKCVSKYLSGYSEYVRQEATQHCYLAILEAVNATPDIRCLECFAINIIKNQIHSKTSKFYYEILRYEKTRRTTDKITNHADDMLSCEFE